MRRFVLLLLTAGLVIGAPLTALGDVGGAEATPASCMGIEAAVLSPPGTNDEIPAGMPGLRAFLREAAPGVPPGQALYSFVARLHEGSHEACDEAIEG